ncbi:MAG TPA: hypothetical protein PLZ15_15110 [Melioribacteraceae bacterium]|nr:hypothetical protein [Melioribacteraceae bacterium]
MELKQGVKSTGIKPEIILAAVIAGEVYKAFEVDFVITSMTDGKHTQQHSLHYCGFAFDIRIKNIPNKKMIDEIFLEIRRRLTKDYQVILETTHIHVEYQPIHQS